jgi:hypothetical protein
MPWQRQESVRPSLNPIPYTLNLRQDVRHAVATAGERPPIPPDCPAPLASLLRECWHPLPEHRPSASSVLLKISQMGVKSKFLELREKRHREEKERRAAAHVESSRRAR